MLSDPEKKKVYDMGGEEALKQGRGAGGGGMSVDPREIFKQFFGEGADSMFSSFTPEGGQFSFNSAQANEEAPSPAPSQLHQIKLTKGASRSLGMKATPSHPILPPQLLSSPFHTSLLPSFFPPLH